MEKNNEAIKFGIQKRQSEHEEKRAYAQQEKEYLEAANLMAREQERLRHLELQKTIGTWDTQVRTKEARDTWDLNDPDALKKTRLPRDPRPIWESRNQGSVSNAQTFACEYRDNPAWKGRVRSDYRSGLAYSMVDLHLKREAEAAEKQADEDLSRAQHQALTMMAAENERILKENRYQLARENQELVSVHACVRVHCSLLGFSCFSFIAFAFAFCLSSFFSFFALSCPRLSITLHSRFFLPLDSLHAPLDLLPPSILCRAAQGNTTVRSNSATNASCPRPPHLRPSPGKLGKDGGHRTRNPVRSTCATGTWRARAKNSDRSRARRRNSESGIALARKRSKKRRWRGLGGIWMCSTVFEILP